MFWSNRHQQWPGEHASTPRHTSWRIPAKRSGYSRFKLGQGFAVITSVFLLSAVFISTAIAAPASEHSVTASLTQPISQTATASPILLQITALSPQVFTTQDRLDVTVSIKNNSASALPAGKLQLALTSSPTLSRQDLSQWMSNSQKTNPFSALIPLAHQLIPALASAGTTSVSFSVLRADLPFLTSDLLGIYGVEVSFVAGSAHYRARNVVIWDSGKPVAASPINVLVPIIPKWGDGLTAKLPATTPPQSASAPTTGGATSPNPSNDQSPSSSKPSNPSAIPPTTATPNTPLATPNFAGLMPLTQADACLSAAKSWSRPGVTLALDPALLTDDLGKVTEQALTGLHALTTTPGSLTYLPWGDPDLSGLIRSQASPIAEAGNSRLQGLIDSKAISTAPNLWWPQNLNAGTTDLAGIPPNATVILSESAWPPLETIPYTPAANATLNINGKTHSALVFDDQLSAALGGNAKTPGEALINQQWALADTALITAQTAAHPRLIVAALPRYSASEPARLQRLQTLLAQRWVKPVSFPTSSINKETDSKKDRAILGSGSPNRAALTPTQTKVLMTAWKESELWETTAIKDPQQITNPLQSALLLSTSAQYQSDPKYRQHVVALASSAASKSLLQVSASPPHSVNMISTQSQIPIRLTNSLPAPVSVSLHLSSSDARLQVPGQSAVQIPANSVITTKVAVKAVGNGNITTKVSLYADDGTKLGSESIMEVRVRAAWESRGLTALAVITALVFVAGIVRTIRRTKRMNASKAGGK